MTAIDPYTELAGALRMDPWARDAACAFEGAADILNEGGTEAKALCDSCPVIRQCTSWVLGLNRITDVDHYSAGMTREERQKARRRIKRARKKQGSHKPAAKPKPKPTTRPRVAPQPAPKKPTEMLPPGMKRCSKCKEVKPHSDFYVENRARDGRAGSCIACKRVANAAAAQVSRDKQADARRRRRADAAYALQTRRPRSKAAA